MVRCLQIAEILDRVAATYVKLISHPLGRNQGKIMPFKCSKFPEISQLTFT